jgi:flagellar M-ring protein FliF
LDGSYVRNGEGVWEYTPRGEEELNRIRQLVSNTVGFNAGRGDTIEVSGMAFGAMDTPVEPNAAEIVSEFASRMGKPLLTALLAFIFIMLVARPLVLALIRPKVEAGEVVEALEGLPAAEEQYITLMAQEEAAKTAEANARAVSGAMEDADALSLDTSLTLDDIKVRALQLAERNIEQTVFILRSWMKDERVKD